MDSSPSRRAIRIGIEAFDWKRKKRGAGFVEDNFNKFAEAVSMLLENHSLRNYLGTNARQFVKSNYNWQGNMKKFDKLMLQTNEHVT